GRGGESPRAPAERRRRPSGCSRSLGRGPAGRGLAHPVRADPLYRSGGSRGTASRVDRLPERLLRDGTPAPGGRPAGRASVTAVAAKNLARLYEEAFERRGDYPSLFYEDRWFGLGE